MGFFKKFQLGKVLGSTARGFAQGGISGAVAQGGTAATLAGFNAATSRAPRGGSLVVQGQQVMGASFAQPSMNFPSAGGGGEVAIPVRGGGVPAVQMTGDVFNTLAKLAERLGVRIMNPNAVVRVGRGLLSKLLRFSRATPGLTILSMLLNVGLTAIEANTIISWYSTAGKRRRRIKVTNVKALNRSVRRLEGFTRLARRVEASIGRRAGVRAVRRGSRCRKCRKSPCGC